MNRTNRKLFYVVLLSFCLAATFLSACGHKLAEDYTLSQTEIEVIQGESLPLAILCNKGASEDYTLTWRSDDPSVAAVDNEGNVAGLHPGTATVTVQVKVKENTVDFACKVTVLENTAKLTSVSFAANIYSLGVNQSLDLSGEVIYDPAGAAAKNLIWSSSDPAVAAVSNGIVTAAAEGAATITATAENGDAPAAVCVVRVLAATVPATDISFETTEYTISAGQTITLSPTVSPEDATGYSVSWTSSDSKVATVSGGKVTGKAEGIATITAQLNNGAAQKTAVCRITVSSRSSTVKATRVSLSPSNLNLTEGDKTAHRFNVTVTPANHTEEIKWSVSDTKMIQIDPSTGIFYLIGELKNTQQAAVIVTCRAGSASDSKVVFISKSNETVIKATHVVLSPSSFTLGEEDRAAHSFDAIITPNNHTETIHWSVSNTKLIQIDPNTGVFRLITGLNGKDSETVTVTCTAGGVSAVGQIFIFPPEEELQLSHTEAILYTDGPQSALEIQAAVTNTDELPDIVWKSSDPTVASVDKNGVVTAKKTGECEITATAKDRPELTAVCKITVESPPYIIVRVGETVELKLDKHPGKNAIWEYDSRYVTIDESAEKITGSQETPGTPITVCITEENQPEIKFSVYVVPIES